MKALMNDNTEREITTLFYWEGNTYHANVPISKPVLESFLVYHNNKGRDNLLVVTETGHLYSCCDTPGYCDGEKTTTANKLIAAFYGLPNLQSI